MSIVKQTDTGQNYMKKYNTGADKGAIPSLNAYEKVNGSDGITNTIFTVTTPYMVGSNTLTVFVNGQKAEEVASASNTTEYEETNSTTITFGSALQNTDVVEIMIYGSYIYTGVGISSELTGLIPGYVQRSIFTWRDADEIYLDGGVYEIGTGIVTWSSQLTFQFGSTGSNVLSNNLTADSWHYLYIDASTIPVTSLTAANFINLTTIPVWSNSKKGWYNGSDRCIAAFLTNGSSQLIDFSHSTDFMSYTDYIQDRSSTDPSTSWLDVTLTAPAFCTKINATIYLIYVSADVLSYYKTKGSSGSTGTLTGQSDVAIGGVHPIDFITDTNRQIQIKHSIAGSTQAIYTNGWYFPIGM